MKRPEPFGALRGQASDDSCHGHSPSCGWPDHTWSGAEGIGSSAIGPHEQCRVNLEVSRRWNWLTDLAWVTDIADCPEIEAGEGRVVTATFHHSSGDVIDLALGLGL